MLSLDRLSRVGLALGVALLAGACLRPLYGQNTGAGPDAPRVSATLATIDVVQATNRIDQQVRNQLIFAFTGGGNAPAPVYRLKIVTVEQIQSAVVDPFTSRPTTETYGLNASYTLTLINPPKTPAGGAPAKPVMTGEAFARASYDRSRQRFASLRARRDAEDRAADVVAQQIVTQVAAKLATQNQQP